MTIEIFFEGPLLNPQRGDKLSVPEAMKVACQEAMKGSGFVSPNPLVGAVVLDSQGRFLQSGFHPKVGEGHAEVMALQGISEEAIKGGTMVVTLEPCAHQGRTPSCAKMLSKLPLAKVIYGLEDPNPLVQGAGAKILKDSGISTSRWDEYEVENKTVDPDLQIALENLAEHFFWNQKHKLPFVSVKVAASLDGQMAMQDGKSNWITNEVSRGWGHRLRQHHDAIITGGGTVRTDNPNFSIRGLSQPKKGKLIVIDPQGELMTRKDLNLLQNFATEDLIWVVSTDSVQMERSDLGHRIWNMKRSELVSETLLKRLYEDGVRSVLLEAGPTLVSLFLEKNLVQRLYLFQAPFIMGGRQEKLWTKNYQLKELNMRLDLKNPKFCKSGGDLLWTGRWN